MASGRVTRITGALVEAQPLREIALYELVHVGHRRLLGEVIRLEDARASIQVFEETEGLALGEPVVPTGAPLTVHLGPGLLGSTLDGLGRPLARVAETAGDRIPPGVAAPTLDPARSWAFRPARRPGDRVAGGDVLGTVDEGGMEHRILVPPDVGGVLAALEEGACAVEDAVAHLEDGRALGLTHSWPVRTPRPSRHRLRVTAPFITGQRVLDLLFPVGEGGAVAVPGGFGTGKTVIEQSLAKWGHADVVVYIGCGERGNEMAEVLEDFASLEDPRTGRLLRDRTVLVVNTSNMPVVAREASVYLGFTVAEYYRDMGYRVALMADSLSRWAEALREIGARAQEMPAEEGYPTHLASRLARLYERAGRVEVLGAPERAGAVTFISAVSPPGGDFSEPVTQASLRVAGALWALDPALAHRRQFPAVDWETSYTLYEDAAGAWFSAEVAEEWLDVRRALFRLLQRDAELREIAGLVGPEALEDADRLVLRVAQLVREYVLGQSAFDPADAYSPPAKTFRMAEAAVRFWERARERLRTETPFDELGLDALGQELGALRAAGVAPAREDAA